MKREELMLGILTDELESYGDGLISAELALAIVKKVFAGEIPEENISPVDKGEAVTAEEVLTKKCLENKVWLTSNERHTMLEAMEEYSALRNHVPDVGKEVEIVPDYRLLLEKYIKYVFEEEGTDCLTFISHSGLGDFTDEDWSILQEISKKVNG